MLSVYGFPFMLAMFVSFVLTPHIKKLAFKIGAVDKPDNRKVHKRIMPRLGGLAIYIAFMIAVVAGMEMSWDIFRYTFRWHGDCSFRRGGRCISTAC